MTNSTYYHDGFRDASKGYDRMLYNNAMPRAIQDEYDKGYHDALHGTCVLVFEPTVSERQEAAYRKGYYDALKEKRNGSL